MTFSMHITCEPHELEDHLATLGFVRRDATHMQRPLDTVVEEMRQHREAIGPAPDEEPYRGPGRPKGAKNKRSKAAEVDPKAASTVSEADQEAEDELIEAHVAAEEADQEDHEAAPGPDDVVTDMEIQPAVETTGARDPAKDYETAMGILRGLYATHKEGVANVLAQFGAEKFKEIKPEQGTELLEHARALEAS